ncbi:hypothetical protein SELMODRAFT_408479 [Selaginella moellendorffii]|uniref:Uncharacterized protein n=1 Tax=Selaginella moellendorffii TaxID=88036 RepID=D8R8F7_SELML|nr:hypothetical protein SELMODRAFT_408479 [Selaginella moellendorffii]
MRSNVNVEVLFNRTLDMILQHVNRLRDDVILETGARALQGFDTIGSQPVYWACGLYGTDLATGGGQGCSSGSFSYITGYMFKIQLGVLVRKSSSPLNSKLSKGGLLLSHDKHYAFYVTGACNLVCFELGASPSPCSWLRTGCSNNSSAPPSHVTAKREDSSFVGKLFPGIPVGTALAIAPATVANSGFASSVTPRYSMMRYGVMSFASSSNPVVKESHSA